MLLLVQLRILVLIFHWKLFVEND